MQKHLLQILNQVYKLLCHRNENDNDEYTKDIFTII